MFMLWKYKTAVKSTASCWLQTRKFIYATDYDVSKAGVLLSGSYEELIM
jgi:hypothetical protein